MNSDQLAAYFNGSLVSASQENMRRLGIIGENAVQTATIVANTTVQANANVSDDAQTFGALRTAVHIPTVDAATTK